MKSMLGDRRVRGEALRFAVVGCINTGVDYALFNALFYLAAWPLLAANAAGFSLAVVVSFALNRTWTFAGVKHDRPMTAQLWRFVLVALGGLAVASLVIWLAALVLPAYLAKLAAVGATFVWNFTLSRLWVWRRA